MKNLLIGCRILYSAILSDLSPFVASLLIILQFKKKKLLLQKMLCILCTSILWRWVGCPTKIRYFVQFLFFCAMNFSNVYFSFQALERKKNIFMRFKNLLEIMLSNYSSKFIFGMSKSPQYH